MTLKLRTALLGSALALTACLEPQPLPDLPQQPSSAFELETIIDGLPSPWAAAEMPGGDFLVTGKFGKLWRVSGADRTELAGLPDEITALAENRLATGGQGGLLDVALAPDFASTGEIYLSYSYGDWDANGTALLFARLVDEQLEDVSTIYKVPTPKAAGSHFGGKIAFTDNDTLLLTLGDGFALREQAQVAENALGSIVALTRSGAPAPGNPSFGPGSAPELFSIGHRNVQGLAIDAATGDIWEHEHGPRGGDELNRLAAGGNYGWPISTFGLDYQGAKITPLTPDTDGDAYIDPVHSWVPSIAPSGLAIYRGAMFSDWNGQALIGGLASGDLRRVDPKTGAETVLLGDMKSDADAFRVRDVDVAQDGSVLLLIEDKTKGRLLRLTPG